MKRTSLLVLAAVCLFYLFVIGANAFSLLGPFVPWMEETNGLRQPGDIGGPMDIGSGYRWNVPVVTYGFDQSFLNYFGKDGVAAVESAIQVLNDLPSASDTVITNYPLDTKNLNYQAQAQNLYDLKSATLVALLEQMGLTQPTRYIFVLRRWDPFFIYYGDESSWPSGTIPNYIAMRNFDPETLARSQSVNGSFYTGFVFSGWPDSFLDGQEINFAAVLPIDPFEQSGTAVEDNIVNGGMYLAAIYLSPGVSFSGLTRDDVGGLRYLLSSKNINYETLFQSVHPVMRGFELYDRRGHLFVDGAWRPGVDKITFTPQPVNSKNGRFLPTSYQFKDIYVKNNTIRWQEVERRAIQPDILFCAGDTGQNSPYTPLIQCTGTTNWLNNAILNGNTNGEGPGVIQPPIKITFSKLGPVIYTGNYESSGFNQSWGSFDASTNLPIVYPTALDSDDGRFGIRLRFFDTDYAPSFELTNIIWYLRVPVGGQVSLQISTNQADWTSLATATNVGSITEWRYAGSDSPPKYFRAVPQ